MKLNTFSIIPLPVLRPEKPVEELARESVRDDNHGGEGKHALQVGSRQAHHDAPNTTTNVVSTVPPAERESDATESGLRRVIR